MSIIQMIGEPLEERHYFCEHHKIPQVVPDVMNYNPPIRLQEMSRLRKLGDNNYCQCKDCNESVCSCLWSRYVGRPAVSEEEPSSSPAMSGIYSQRDYRLAKGWSIRNQLLEKIREGYIRCKSKQSSTDTNKCLIYRKKSLIWLLRPTKKMRRSETNMIVTNTKPPTLRPSTAISQPPYKYQPNLEACIRDKPLTKNWPLSVHSQSLIPKGRKEYFNERRRRLCSQIKRQPMMENELEKGLYREKKLPTTPMQSLTQIKDWKGSLENISAYQKDTTLEDVPLTIEDPEDYIEKLLTETNEESEASSTTSLDTKSIEIESKSGINTDFKTPPETKQSFQESNSINSMYAVTPNRGSKENSLYETITKSFEAANSSCKKGIESNCPKHKESGSKTNKRQPKKGVPTSTQTSGIAIAVRDKSPGNEYVSSPDSCLKIVDSDELTEKPEPSASLPAIKATVTVRTNPGPMPSKVRLAAASPNVKIKLPEPNEGAKGRSTKDKSKSIKLDEAFKPKINTLSESNKRKIVLRSAVILKAPERNTAVNALKKVDPSAATAPEILNLTNLKMSKGTQKKELGSRQKKLTRKRPKKPASTTTSQSTIADVFVEPVKANENKLIKSNLFRNELLKSKNSVTEFSTETGHKLRRHTLPTKEIPRRPLDPKPDTQSKRSEHLIIPAENQPSLVTISNNTVTYSFHRPISYEELYSTNASCDQSK